ncbi:autophagy protein Apg6-domain-containing protein [Lipomyces oligophaga]|uniref:autophagy protein Apg6-domain-containing protein n=1 Tax=Lipomyces oligophaga TaxID=45792 RepID=UPI0034CF1621
MMSGTRTVYESKKALFQPIPLCRRCRQPLDIQELSDLDNVKIGQTMTSSAPVTPGEPNGNSSEKLQGTLTPASMKARTSGISYSNRSAHESFVLLSDSMISRARKEENVGSYETMIRKSEDANKEADIAEDDNSDGEGGLYSLSSRLRISDRVYDLVNGKTDIDHPVCSECLQSLVAGLRQQCAETLREKEAYNRFYEQVQKEKPSLEEQISAEKELEKISTEQANALAELKAAEQEREAVEKEIEDLQCQSRLLDEEEEKFWIARNNYETELEEFLFERDMIRNKLQHDTELVRRLQATNVFTDVFAMEGASAAANLMLKKL